MYNRLKALLKSKPDGREESGTTRSFSQYGEDQIILALLFIFKLENVTYLDIGANDPYRLNNTALLYEKGFSGVNIEPDPGNFSRLSVVRKKDINLNIGIGASSGILKYYRFTDSVYNTFSQKEYQHLLGRDGLEPLPALDVEVQTYTQVIAANFGGKPPVLLFIDTEGLDEEIIDSIDFDNLPPRVICIETFSYGEFKKDHALIAKILNKGYHIHADTFVNTIFIHQSLLPYPETSRS
jgi:FkbM family methyltransferase